MKGYNGVLQRPFLAEHWHNGIVAAMAAWLPCFCLTTCVIPDSIPFAVGFASTVSGTALVAALTQYEGFELQPQAARYRIYTWVLGLRFGRWQPLPLIDHVTLRPRNRSHSLLMIDNSDPVTLGFAATDFKWQVLLSVVNSPIGIVAAYAVEKKAALIAADLGKVLNVKIQNETTG